jgi:hypothetical protein
VLKVPGVLEKTGVLTPTDVIRTVVLGVVLENKGALLGELPELGAIIELGAMLQGKTVLEPGALLEPGAVLEL